MKRVGTVMVLEVSVAACGSEPAVQPELNRLGCLCLQSLRLRSLSRNEATQLLSRLMLTLK